MHQPFSYNYLKWLQAGCPNHHNIKLQQSSQKSRLRDKTIFYNLISGISCACLVIRFYQISRKQLIEE